MFSQTPGLLIRKLLKTCRSWKIHNEINYENNNFILLPAAYLLLNLVGSSGNLKLSKNPTNTLI